MNAQKEVFASDGNGVVLLVALGKVFRSEGRVVIKDPLSFNLMDRRLITRSPSATAEIHMVAVGVLM